MNSIKKSRTDDKLIQKTGDTLPTDDPNSTSSSTQSLENQYILERINSTKRGITPQNTSPSKKPCLKSGDLLSNLSFAGADCYENDDICAEKPATKCIASVELLQKTLDNSVCRPCVINNQLGIIDSIFEKVQDIAERSSMGRKHKDELKSLRDYYLSRNIAQTKKNC